MARRKKRKSQPVVMRKKDTGKMVIKVDDSKVPWGHMNQVSATVHADSRLKRRRTRGALRQSILADQD